MPLDDEVVPLFPHQNLCVWFRLPPECHGVFAVASRRHSTNRLSHARSRQVRRDDAACVRISCSYRAHECGKGRSFGPVVPLASRVLYCTTRRVCRGAWTCCCARARTCVMQVRERIRASERAGERARVRARGRRRGCALILIAPLSLALILSRNLLSRTNTLA